MQITVDPEVLKELEYMMELHLRHGAPNRMETVHELVAFVLASVADGSRRPGAWERELCERMGLVADCPEHQQYRANYGPPTSTESGRDMANTKDKESFATKERWDALAPHEFEHNNEKRTGWTRLGAAFPIKDGGFTLKLRAFPVPQGDGEATVVVKRRSHNETPADWDLP